MSDRNPLGIGSKGPPRDTDYANMRGAYGYLGIMPFTQQEELFLLTRLRGMSIRASAQAAGFSAEKGAKLLKQERTQTMMEYFRQQLYDDARISLEMLNSMSLEAHRKAVSATEELKAVETLAKLNQLGGYAHTHVLKERAEQSRERDITPRSHRELERMSEGKLLELAALDGLGSLDPEPAASGEVMEGELLDD